MPIRNVHNLKKAIYFVAVFLAAMCVSNSFLLRAEEKPVKLVPLLSALRDIESGTEIWASYGPYYDYDKFMNAPAVRDFFCGLIKIDCGEFAYEP